MNLIKKLYWFLNKEGLSGLQKKLDDKKKNRVWKGVLKISNDLLGWENMLNLWVKIDNKAVKDGWAEASKTLLNKVKIEISNKGDLEMIKERKETTLMIGVNHEAVLEPFILAAILGERKTSLISLKVLQLLGRGYRQFIMPVMPRRYAADEKRFNRWVVNKVHPRGRFYGIEGLKAAEIDEMNEKAFAKAINNLEKGTDVILFAAGGKVAKSSWGRALGEIVCRIDKRKRSNIRVALFNFSGIKQKEVAKRFWRAASGKSLDKMEVTVESRRGFSVQEIKDTLGDNFDSKNIVNYLKEWSLEEFGYNKVKEKKTWNLPQLVYQPAYARVMTLLTFIRMRM